MEVRRFYRFKIQDISTSNTYIFERKSLVAKQILYIQICKDYFEVNLEAKARADDSFHELVGTYHQS